MDLNLTKQLAEVEKALHKFEEKENSPPESSLDRDDEALDIEVEISSDEEELDEEQLKRLVRNVEIKVIK